MKQVLKVIAVIAAGAAAITGVVVFKNRQDEWR